MPDSARPPRAGALPTLVLVVGLEQAPRLLLVGADDERGTAQLADWISRLPPVIVAALSEAFVRYRFADEPPLDEEDA